MGASSTSRMTRYKQTLAEVALAPRRKCISISQANPEQLRYILLSQWTLIR